MNKYFSSYLKHIKNLKDFYESYIFLHLIIIDKIIKTFIRTIEKNYCFFISEEQKNKSPIFKNDYFEEKNELVSTVVINEAKMIKNDNNKITINEIKKRKNNIITIIIKFILINIFYKIKCNLKFDIFNSQYSSKITLRIKGVGEKYILGNEVGYNFTGINYLKEVRINGNKQDTIKYKYYFNQEDNEVELVWDDNINDCSYMFRKCSGITEIDLSNFNASQVIYMNRIFSHCSSLTSLDFSNLDTSKVTDMWSMFSHCSSLTSLDLSNFDTSQAKNMNYMFYDCTKLEYINLNNFVENNLNEVVGMFHNVYMNVVVCMGDISIQSKILSALGNLKKCYAIDCKDDFDSKNNKLNNNDNECNKKCDKSSQYPYEYNGKCKAKCKKGFLYDDYNNKLNICKCELDECLLCPKEALDRGLCSKCNNDYYPKENDPLNINEYKKCYEDPEGFYLDNNLYKRCYHTCKKCVTLGNNMAHNCIECNKNFPIKITNTNTNYNNCYEKCIFYYYFDNNNNYHCTLNSTCPNEYPKLNESKKECIKYNKENILKDLVTKEKNETEKMTKEEEIEYFNNVKEKVEKILTEGYDTSNIDNKQDEIINIGKMTLTISTPENQKNNINSNMTSIDLGDCEALLRDEYNISINDSIYIAKIDIEQDGLQIPKVEYNIFSKLFGTNLIQLNLTVCSNSKILIYAPFKLNGNSDKYNKSSGYYNDICYTTTSEDGTDITLKDRKKHFIEGNNIVCQENCEFSKYNSNSMKAECTCKIKESSSSKIYININKTKLFEDFKDIKNFVNFKILYCYKKLFNLKGMKYNIGCYILTGIILYHIICSYIFCLCQFLDIKKKIKDIISGINEYHLTKYSKKNNRMILVKRKQNNENKYIKYNSDKNKMIPYKKVIKKRLNKKKNRIIPIQKKPKLSAINFNNINNIFKNQNFFYRIDKNTKNNNNNYIPTKNNNRKRSNSNFNYNKKEKIENIMKYTDEETNTLSYNLALIYDKRSYCQYYISLLKTKHNLICAICNNNDYNLKIIKMDLFFIGFSIEYIVNALFFNDDTMHNIYENKGKYDLEAQLSIIVYSFLISMILNTPLGLLALSNDSIIKFKQNKSKINLIKRAEDLKTKLTIKFIFYFIISTLLLAFFWYYISMFCVIYRNTQIYLLKDTLMSFGLSLFIPFWIYLLPGFFRIPALSNKKNKRECLYNFSKILQLI